MIAALLAAGKAMLQDGRDGAPKTNRGQSALAWRVGLSIALFLFVLLSYQDGVDSSYWRSASAPTSSTPDAHDDKGALCQAPFSMQFIPCIRSSTR